jgi:hypothetical protein
MQGKVMGKSKLTSSLAQKNPSLQGHQVRFLEGDISSKVQLSEEVAIARRKRPSRARRIGISIEGSWRKEGELGIES